MNWQKDAASNVTFKVGGVLSQPDGGLGLLETVGSQLGKIAELLEMDVGELSRIRERTIGSIPVSSEVEPGRPEREPCTLATLDVLVNRLSEVQRHLHVNVQAIGRL